MEYMNTRIKKAMELIENAEHILIGAGAGLSAAAGLTYGGDRFEKYFSDFKAKYGIADMYSASFYPFKTQEEFWAQWARHINVNRYQIGSTQLYEELYDLVKNKSHFVITTNVESQFIKSGFSEHRIFEVQGNYAYLQCANACHDILYYNEDIVSVMEDKCRDCKIPTELVPKCPVCGGSMDVNLRHNNYFVQDERWYDAQSRYEAFLDVAMKDKLLLMEFGVGYNTPGIIRYPFEKMVYENKNVDMIRFNKDFPSGVDENAYKTVTFDEDISDILANMKAGVR